MYYLYKNCTSKPISRTPYIQDIRMTSVLNWRYFRCSQSPEHAVLSSEDLDIFCLCRPTLIHSPPAVDAVLNMCCSVDYN